MIRLCSDHICASELPSGRPLNSAGRPGGEVQLHGDSHPSLPHIPPPLPPRSFLSTLQLCCIKTSLQPHVPQFPQELHQTAIMKFVTLALATLLALGCQAASLQADAPNSPEGYLKHARGLMDLYFTQIQTSAHNIAEKITDPEIKEMINTRVDALAEQIKALRAQAEPLTDGALQTASEATAELRANLQADVESLQKQLEPMRANLKTVVDKHIEEYKAQLMPLMQEYQANQQQQMAEWKAKLEPVMEELRAKIAVNVEETKGALMPIVDTIRGKVSERVENLRQMVDPYVQEYKEQLKSAVGQAQNIDHAALMAKARPHFDSLKACLEDFAAKMKTLME